MAAKVLLVEPDKDARDEFVAAIKGSEFEVCHCSSTNAEAVEECDQVRPDIIVLRLVSGKMGAAAALEALRKKNHSVKTVGSYEVRSTHLLMAAYAHGVVAAVKRPFHLPRVVEKLMFAIAAEQHEKLNGPIVRLEHPLQVRYKAAGFLARSRVGFSERMGLTDMDLNTEKSLKVKAVVKSEILFPPPTGTMKFAGVVEDVEMRRAGNWCAYVSFKDTTPETRKAIESFLVKAARKP